MNANDFATVVVSLLGGTGLGGIVAAVVSKRRAEAEGRETEIRGELQVVEAYRGFVEGLREEVTRLAGRMKHAEELIETLRAENTTLVGKVNTLERENLHLSDRCAALEHENATLKNEIDKAPGA